MNNGFQLRDYQEKAIADLRQARLDGHRCMILCAPTGAGKTAIARAIILNAKSKGRKCLFLVPLRVLVRQSAREFMNMGLQVGIMQASNTRYSESDDVLVACIATFRNRPAPDWVSVVLIDEVHIWHLTHARLIEEWATVPFIGLSATPLREGLGAYFTSLICAPTTRWLTDNGFLVPVRAFCPDATAMAARLKGLKVRGGDFVESQAADVLSERALVGDLVETWKEKGEGRLTLAFATTVEHSLVIRDAFLEAGIGAAHIDASTKDRERGAILEQFRAGKIPIITSVGCLTTGFDVPVASCGIFARPTLSRSLWMQMAGRLIRTAPGKKNAIFLDHVGNVIRHGLPVDFAVTRLDEADHRKKDDEPAVSLCPACGAVMERGNPICPECGWERPQPKPTVQQVDGDLVEYNHDRVKMIWYQSLRGIAADRDYKPAWASLQFRDRFGHLPPKEWASWEPRRPRPEVKAWVRERQRQWLAQQRQGD